MADRDLIRFYFDTVSLNEHLVQWYRAVLLAFHVGIITTLLVPQVNGAQELLQYRPFLLALGLIVSLLWVGLTSQREAIVSRQERKIKELAENDEDVALRHCFEIYGKGWRRNAAPFIFNFCLPTLVGILLIVMFRESVTNCLIPFWAIAIIFFSLSSGIYAICKCKSSWVGLPKVDKTAAQVKKPR